ncbi:unnamed protein product [Mytilus coruscus]|uniref:Uncharacterized protein n=1 Tax=Mytilus coruscus TaxID=42192 RepID=A0A6J8A5F9_MYTCO|nr:unnamed protein product [Mytilus coruscus]
MVTINEIEFDPEAYTSILLMQKALKGCNSYPFLINQIPELRYIVENPRVVILKQNNDEWSLSGLCSMLTHNTDMVMGSLSTTDIKAKQWKCPFVIVVLLRASGGHGSCRLSRSDHVILNELKKHFKCLDDIIYVLKDTRHTLKYDEEDLEKLSEEIQLTACGFKNPNNVFSRLFIFPDKQISVRLGLSLHRSIQRHLFDVRNISQNYINETNSEYAAFTQSQNQRTKLLSDNILKYDFRYCSQASTKKKQEQIRTLTNRLFKLIEVTFRQNLLKPILKRPGFKSSCVKLLRSITDTKQERKHTSIPLKEDENRNGNLRSSAMAHTSLKHSCSFKCKIKISKLEAVTVAELMYAEQLKVLTNYVKAHTKDIAIFCSYVNDECIYDKMHGVSVHEFKTVAYRHDQVVGFGYIDGTICVYLQGNQENNKERVLDFIKRYVDTTKHNYRIEFRKKREISYFAKLEPGSKVNKFHTTDTDKYGTLGMFLEDNNGRFYFTTCAHVIDRDAYAYLPDDNSKIGQNVFVCNTTQNNKTKTSQQIDLSLVRVLPDNDIECKLGLKSLSGDFIKRAVIFQEDISLILGRRLYKWGATEPLLQTGRCIGIEEQEDEFVHLQIDKENFAKPGDSGAIICVGDNNDTGLAAFVLVGEYIRADNKKEYAVYKVTDALETVEKLKKKMTPCLCTDTITISSTPRSSIPAHSSSVVF